MPRIGLYLIEAPAATLLRECFRVFEMETIALPELNSLQKEKFDGLVLSFSSSDAESALAAVRSSPRNQKAIVYGIYSDTKELLRFSRYGINALLEGPLERPNVLKVVRSTQLLVQQEFRRYVRIPLATTVRIEREGKAFEAVSREISGGGMSLKVATASPFSKGDPLTLSFGLPGSLPIQVKASVCWKYENETLIGIQYDRTDDSRRTVRGWIDEYLE